MAPTNPLADWEKVGDRFYRKIRIYDAVFDEDLELENFIVTGAPYGGAIGELLSTNLIPFLHFPLFSNNSRSSLSR